MNVLLVWNGPVTRGERSILARREVAFLRCLVEQGVRAQVALCRDDGGLAHELREAGIPTHVLPTPLPPGWAALRRMPGAIFRLRALVRELHPDLVEATEPMPAIACGFARWPRRQRPVVVYRCQHAGGRTRLLLASRLAAFLSDRTIVSCEAMRRRAADDDGSEMGRIEVATPGSVDPPAVGAEEVAAWRRFLGIDDSALIIAAVSRLRREKGLDVLIRSLEHLTGIGDVHLIVAGTGPEEPLLRQLAAASPIQVHFLGHRDDVPVLLQAADVVVIPSRRESFGRLTLEAMAAGRPVVATHVGGLPEAIVDGETGLLVPAEDEASLGAAIRIMLTDRMGARRRGESARERFRARYTIPHMATARISAWGRALAAGGVR